MLSAVAGGGLTAAGLGGPLGAQRSGAETTAALAREGADRDHAGEHAGRASTETGQHAEPRRHHDAHDAPRRPGTSTSCARRRPRRAAGPPEAPTVVLQRKQKTERGQAQAGQDGRQDAEHDKRRRARTQAAGPNNVAGSPQAVASQAALEAVLASSDASVQALGFYRIPLFLLPIYKAAAVQYGVPWQILAAINEIETDYGSDLSVSTAGAVGWMQFMPATWLQYGVDALNAGYADPYNPVDAIFAAARYLRAAGAATNLNAAILAYNHSQEYVTSVLLRAKLISTYPKAVIATLTGLIDGRLPVTGKQVAWCCRSGHPVERDRQRRAARRAAASGTAGRRRRREHARLLRAAHAGRRRGGRDGEGRRGPAANCASMT